MRPLLWLGAPSAGGLALPDASPAPCRFYAPRGVFLGGQTLVVADTGNHRVLIWSSLPQHEGTPADVVLGQRDFDREGPKAGGAGAENGLFLPTAVGIWEGRLFVADAWHHRILVWNEVPRVSFTPPDYAIGQPNLSSVEPNCGGTVSREGLNTPYGMAWIDGCFWVCDTSNRRVLGWHGIPTRGKLPDIFLGQPTWDAGEENRGEGCGPRSFRWPHAIASAGDWTYIADAGNHRILGWSGILDQDRDADAVIGQPDFVTNFEFAYRAQGPDRLRFPYALAATERTLLVGDTANNRLLVWKLNEDGSVQSLRASGVIGQPDFNANGENHWLAVTSETLCWPYGVSCNGPMIALADSGNNRVMLWSADTPNVPQTNEQEEEALCVSPSQAR